MRSGRGKPMTSSIWRIACGHVASVSTANNAVHTIPQRRVRGGRMRNKSAGNHFNAAANAQRKPPSRGPTKWAAQMPMAHSNVMLPVSSVAARAGVMRRTSSAVARGCWRYAHATLHTKMSTLRDR